MSKTVSSFLINNYVAVTDTFVSESLVTGDNKPTNKEIKRKLLSVLLIALQQTVFNFHIFRFQMFLNIVFQFSLSDK